VKVTNTREARMAAASSLEETSTNHDKKRAVTGRGSVGSSTRSWVRGRMKKTPNASSPATNSDRKSPLSRHRYARSCAGWRGRAGG
jgi:hypothetical protein